MEIILFDKDYGIYEKDQVIGKEGHFITSPLVSKHFSHCIAKNFVKIYNDEKIEYLFPYQPVAFLNFFDCKKTSLQIYLNLLQYNLELL